MARFRTTFWCLSCCESNTVPQRGAGICHRLLLSVKKRNGGSGVSLRDRKYMGCTDYMQLNLTVVELKRWLCCQQTKMSATELEPTTMSKCSMVDVWQTLASYLKRWLILAAVCQSSLPSTDFCSVEGEKTRTLSRKDSRTSYFRTNHLLAT